jgi:TRAP-type C4-dicarboxylate transport system permease small subunit
MFNVLKHAVERLLEVVVILLMAVLAVVVLVGVTWRAAGAALSWYDELASILLCWLTFYGAALAALKRAHIGVPDVVTLLPPTARAVAFVVAEALVFGFFALAAWMGWFVIEVLEGSYLVSMPEIPVSVAQSVIPIGAILFIVAEALSLPAAWRHAMPAAPLARDVAATE